jgi:hypothetical protein
MMGLEGDRVEATDDALSFGAIARLDQGQKPGQPGDGAASERAMVTERTMRAMP